MKIGQLKIDDQDKQDVPLFNVFREDRGFLPQAYCWVESDRVFVLDVAGGIAARTVG